MAKQKTGRIRQIHRSNLIINRKYKDRLFRFLFQDKRDLLELYNAVNGSDYTDPEELDIITLDDVIFMKMKNDLSFMISNQLNLYEHQSTYSPNMPLRGLLYFARQYEGLTALQKEKLYSSVLIKLPTPEYVIFYNGKKEQADRTILHLSDAFEAGRGSGCLECRTLMLNINRGHNRELMAKCRRLWEYSEFVAEVNGNLNSGMSLGAAVTKAMDTCIRKDILADILRKNQSEVFTMLLTEYDEKKHMKLLYREGKEAGYKQGRQELLEKQIRKKLQRGKDAASIADELEMEIGIVDKIIQRIQSP